MVLELREQPVRTIYIVASILLLLFVRVPYWSIYYIPKSLRPRPSWPLFRCVAVNVAPVVSNFGEVAFRAGPILSQPDHRAIPKSSRLKAVWIPSVNDLVVGELKLWAANAEVSSVSIPGYWYDRAGCDTPVGQKPLPGEKVILYTHGSGFVCETAHSKGSFGSLIKRLTSTHPVKVSRTLAVEYRLTTGQPLPSTNPFPAALIDSLAAYAYLIQLGFTPKDIILAGDSAGGNLALGLTRYLVEYHRLPEYSDIVSPPPGALITISPWSDLGSSHSGPNTSSHYNDGHDIIFNPERGILLHARKWYLGPLQYPDALESNRYISPASLHPSMGKVSFEGFPRTLIIAGGAELFIDQIRTLRDFMREQLGEEWVDYYEIPDGVHDGMGFAVFEPEISLAYKAVEEWMSHKIQ
ncbi:alpha/beta-hydrolase [Panus rudis PR-1116 ss-1]|nr:alpha/beta-hydrolase [Panus rudis PR-1116 ss-1]